MVDRISCENCQQLQGHIETITDMPVLAEPLVPVVGQSAVDAMVKSEIGFAEEVIAATSQCPGYKPYPKYLRTLVKFFEGTAGVAFVETISCANPVLNDINRIKTQKAERMAFEDLRDGKV